MKPLQLLWDALNGLLSKIMAWIYDRNAKRFETSGVAARRCELIATVPRGGSVLEVGAGTGSTLNAGAYAGAPGRFGRIVMMEPDLGMRQNLERRVANISGSLTLEVSDAALPDLPFSDASFDAVACFLVLSHVHERPKALREIARVLKVGGRVLLMDHGAHEHKHGHGHSHEAHAGSGQGGHHHGNKWQFFWFKEWFNFVFVRRPSNAKIEVLLEDFYKESKLCEDFVSRMSCEGAPFKELCYGTFMRTE